VSFPESDSEAQKSVTAFLQRLRESGWTEGGNIRIEYRWTGTDTARIKSAAAELIELKPDAIIAGSLLRRFRRLSYLAWLTACS
jgi:putative tryptophan/tyrosine transport system substrate-binding protein